MTEGTYHISRVWPSNETRQIDIEYCIIPLTSDLRRLTQVMLKHFNALQRETGRVVTNVAVDFRATFWISKLPPFLDDDEGDFERDLTDWEPFPGQSPLELLAETQAGEESGPIPLQLEPFDVAVLGSELCMVSPTGFYLRCRLVNGLKGETATFTSEMLEWLLAKEETEVSDGLE